MDSESHSPARPGRRFHCSFILLILAVLVLVSSLAPPAAAQSDIVPLDSARIAAREQYAAITNIWRFVSFLTLAGALALVAFTGLSARLWRLASRLKYRFPAVAVYVTLLGLTVYLLRWPFRFYRGYLVETQFGFMNQTFSGWFGDDLLRMGMTVLIAVLPVWLLYRLIRRMRRWWLAATLLSAPLAVLLVVIAPVVIDPVFNDFIPLKDQHLKARLVALSERAGIDNPEIFEVDASRQSSRLNAYVTGLFGSSRIVLYDTLIDELTEDEVVFVVGHEMGHYIKAHVWWGTLLTVIAIGAMLWVASRAGPWIVRRWGRRLELDSFSEVASLPVVLLLIVIMSFVGQPISNSYSRWIEHTCDRYAMELTPVDPAVAVQTFQKLGAHNLSDPDPNPLIEFWFYTHPSLSRRIAFVSSFESVGRSGKAR